MAATSLNTWIVTGGTNSGVMKLVGDIMDRASLKSPPPVIGVAALSGIEERTRIRAVRNQILLKKILIYFVFQVNVGPQLALETPNSYQKTTEIGVNTNHSHFFLIDDGRENKYGGEIKFRGAFELALSKLYNCPVVTLVIQVIWRCCTGLFAVSMHV